MRFFFINFEIKIKIYVEWNKMKDEGLIKKIKDFRRD